MSVREDLIMYKPLSNWMAGKEPLPERFCDNNIIDEPIDSWSTWLSIEEVVPLHKAAQMNWLGLKDSRKNTYDYITSAEEIVGGHDCGWLDREDHLEIIEKLGEPPQPSCPIYIISCKDEDSEKIVYIGKTETASRFNGGHSAALKLHDPEYDGKEKLIYRGSIWFHDDTEYLHLDWIQPEDLAVNLLDSIESQLIYFFKPVLNEQKMKKYYGRWDFIIHIQNFLKGGFLDDCFIFSPA